MKTKRAKTMVVLLGSLAAIPISSHAFNSGSDGSFGTITMTNTNTTPLTNTLTMPANGVFNCTSVSIGTNCVLNFVPNGLNTPVYILAQTNILINGAVDVSGQPGLTNGSVPTIPGPGGFAGGAGGIPTANVPASYGQGPGGGAGGISSVFGGSFGTEGNQVSLYNVSTYGNLLLVPLIGGSGGGGVTGSGSTIPGGSGGSGGGAIMLASSTSVTVAGVVQARGGPGLYLGSGYYSASGSGGGIRIVAPAVSVAGSLDVSGGINSNSGGICYGGNGRVRIDTISQVNARAIGNNQAGAAIVSYGRSLFVFSPVTPQLYFLSAAGTSIPAGATNALSVSLPSGSPNNQIVTLCGTNFLGTVPVEIVAVPVNGAPFITNIVLNFPNTNSFVETNVTITVPSGIPTQLSAYADYYLQP